MYVTCMNNIGHGSIHIINGEICEIRSVKLSRKNQYKIDDKQGCFNCHFKNVKECPSSVCKKMSRVKSWGDSFRGYIVGETSFGVAMELRR